MKDNVLFLHNQLIIFINHRKKKISGDCQNDLSQLPISSFD